MEDALKEVEAEGGNTFQVSEELRQEINAEIEYEAQRLALIRECKEAGTFETVTLSDVKTVALGSKLWFRADTGRNVMVQVLEIDYEASTVGVRPIPEPEAKKVLAKGTNRKERRNSTKASKRAR